MSAPLYGSGAAHYPERVAANSPKPRSVLTHHRQSTDRDRVIVSILQSDAEFDSLQDDWLRLSHFDSTPVVFRGWHWNRLWWKHYKQLGQLQIITVSVSGSIECIAPFYKSTSRFLSLQRVSAIRFLGTGGDTSPDDVDVLYNPAYEQATLAAVCQTLLEQDDVCVFQLMELPSTSAFLKQFLTLAEEQSLPAAQLRQHERRVMALPDSMEAYLALLSRNTRKRTKQRYRKLSKAGHVEFKHCTTDSQVKNTLDDLARLHHARRGGRDKSDSFQSKSYTQFHLELMQALLVTGELRLMSMLCEQKTIGVEYGFRTGGVLSFFQTGFDPEYDWLSPGHIMMLRLVEESIDTHATEIDLLKGNYDYKRSYAKQRRRTLSIDLWRKPAHATVKSMMTSLQQDRLAAPWREVISQSE